MLKLIDLNRITSGLDPVSSPEYFVGKTTTFHPDGLFSEKIFGSLDTPLRKKTYSFVELNCQILHPALYPVIRRLKRNILEAMSGEQSFSITEEGDLILDPKGDISGLSSVIENFSRIKFRGESSARDDLIKMIQYNFRKDLVFIDKCYIIPPHYRPIEIRETGEISVSPINDFYVKIIRLATQLQAIKSGTVFDVLAYRMNQLVLELYSYLTSRVSKKTGILRGDVLGKRVDFTARAVISGSAAELRPDQLGIPLNIMVKIFEPFIIYDLLNSNFTPKEELSKELEDYNKSKLSALALRRLFVAIYKQDEVPNGLLGILIKAINRAIKDKVVLAKRDPALHAESVQAFYPVLVPGNTIKIHPIKCSAFNADFDGDQMALFVPVTRQAIEEAKEKMMITISKDGMNQIMDSFEKDTAIGIYVLTQIPKTSRKTPVVIRKPEDLKNLDMYDPVRYDSQITTVGRVLFNQVFPEGMEFINDAVSKKQLNQLANSVYKKFGREVYIKFSDDITKLSFKYGTIASPSFGLEDLEVPNDILKVKEEIKGMSPEEASIAIQKTTKDLGVYLEDKKGNLGVIGKAGALKGGYDQTRQILVAKGLTMDSSGNVSKPISNSYAEGFTSIDFFKTGSGSRKGISDRVLNTADTGYLTRKLVYALQRVEADGNIFNCGTSRAFDLKITNDIAKRLTGRYLLTKQGRPISFDANNFIGKIVPLKSPIYCLSSKICKTCYGDLLERNNTPYVGILAGQIFGERGTQLIMRTFHTGGAVSLSSIDILKSIIDPLDDKTSRYVRKYFKQEKNNFISLVSGNLVIRTSEYLDPKKDIIRTNSNYQLQYGYFHILTEHDIIFDATLDIKTEVPITGKKVIINDNQVVIPFSKNEVIFTCSPQTDAFTDKVKIIQHLLSGKKPWTSAGHFVMKVYDQYSSLTNCDLCHFEVLAGQLLRDASNPSFPARLNSNYKAVIGSLKKIPALESWLSALMFEDPNTAVSTGLVYDREHKESVLERIVSGTL